MAARERIFSMDVGEIKESVKEKPRTVPIVARRMIAHALGQKINSCTQDDNARDFKDHEEQPNEPSIQDKDKVDNNLKTKTCQDTVLVPGQTADASSKANSNTHKHNSSVVSEGNFSDEAAQKRPSDASMPGRGRNRVNKGYSKDEHIGAAKRMFANALGLRAAKDGVLSKDSERKRIDNE